MNNKGFAITTILYGIMILFCLLLVSLLGILSSYRKTQELLIEENNGARSIANGESVIYNNSGNDDETGNSSGSGDEGGNEGNNNDEPVDIEYTLKFVCKKGNFVGKSSEYKLKSGTTFTLSRFSYYCDALNFMGWNTNENATTVLSSIKINDSDITLYSIFRNNNSGDLTS